MTSSAPKHAATQMALLAFVWASLGAIPMALAERPAGLSPAIAAAWDATEQYPEDYASWSALGYAAEAADHPDVARVAWQKAAQLSGGNHESAAALDRLTAPLDGGQPGQRPDQLWGGVYLTSQTHDAPYTTGSSGVTAEAGARVYDLLTLGAAARTTTLTLSDDIGGGESDQTELWARAGVDRAGHGGRLTVGRVWHDSTDALGSATSEAAWVVGAEGWYTYGATWVGSAVYSQYADGEGAQLGLSAHIPLIGPLSLELGGQYTALDSTAWQWTGSAFAQESASESGLSGLGALHLRSPTWSISAGGRYGVEHRPVRLGEASVWNTLDPVGASAFLAGTYALTDELGLYAGYEWLRLEPDSDGDTDIHAVTVGVTFNLGD